MVHIVWSSFYEVGVPALDKQHQHLLALRNRLEDCINGQRDATHSEAFHDVLDALYQYSVTHFRDEEAYIDAVGFPEAAAHGLAHAHFTETIADLNMAVAQGRAGPHQVLDFLSDWLVSHILSADMQFRRAVRRGGA